MGFNSVLCYRFGVQPVKLKIHFASYTQPKKDESEFPKTYCTGWKGIPTIKVCDYFRVRLWLVIKNVRENPGAIAIFNGLCKTCRGFRKTNKASLSFRRQYVVAFSLLSPASLCTL